MSITKNQAYTKIAPMMAADGIYEVADDPKHYAMADTSKGWFRRNLTALDVLEHVGYRVELSTLVEDDDSEREAWTIGRMNRHLEQRGAKSADEAAEMFLESMLGESRLTGFEGDKVVMPDDDFDDWIERQPYPEDFHEKE